MIAKANEHERKEHCKRSLEFERRMATEQWLWAAHFFWPFQMGHHIIIIIVRQHYNHRKWAAPHKGHPHPNHKQKNRLHKWSLGNVFGIESLCAQLCMTKWMRCGKKKTHEDANQLSWLAKNPSNGPGGVMIALFHYPTTWCAFDAN